MTLNYRLPIGSSRTIRYMPSFPKSSVVSDDEPMGLIEGKTPDSKEEWWIALALWKLGHDFSYQVPVFGGYWVRGGQILDFIVHSTVPRETIIQFNGDYWHHGGDEEIFSQQRLEEEYRDRANILVMWSEDAPNKDETFAHLRRNL
jgi:hypothetical protein